MAKRNYGNGRVFKRGNRWWVAYFVDGNEQRESCGPNVASKAGAQKLLRERLRAADLGLSQTNATVGDLLDLFVQDQAYQSRKSAHEATLRADKIREALGHLRASAVSAQQIARFVAGLKDKGRSGPTINRYRAVWQRAYKLASHAGLQVSPAYWPRHAESAPKRDPIDHATYRLIFDHLSGPFRALTVAAYWTGCRQGELRAWRWAHVDFDRGAVLLPVTKNGRPRVVPIGQEVKNELYVLQLRRERDFPGCEWVFTLDGREPLSKQSVRSAWDRLRKDIGMPSLRFHAFRHTAISNLRAAGIEEGTAMAISGHRTRAVFDRYGIQPEAKLHEAMKKLETKIRTKDGQSEAKGPADQAVN